MTSTTFTTGSPVPKEWLNDANRLIYTIFANISATPSAGKIFRSNGTNVVPTTFTIPDTYAIGDLIYASAANVLSSLAKSNSAVLVTDSSGVPAWDTAGLNVDHGGTGLTTMVAAGNVPVAASATTMYAATFPFAAASIINGKITRSVGSSALTIAVKGLDGNDPSASNPVFVMAPTVTSNVFDGGYAMRTITGALSVVISSGSTLGHTNAIASAVYVYLIDNAGTLELAASSKYFGGTSVQSSTAEGGAGASDSAAVLYSTTARSSVATICLQRWKSTQTTAGTWAATTGEVQLYPFPRKSPLITRITATGTYTKSWDALDLELYAKGQGGGGGGSSSVGNGGGGGEGEETWLRIDASLFTPHSLTVTIGSAAGGAVNSNTNANGGTGSTTSIGALLTAIGGIGGTSGNNGGAGGTGGTGGTGADKSFRGDTGHTGSDTSGSTVAIGAPGGGKGAGSALSNGGANSGGGGGGGSIAAASGPGGSGVAEIIEHYV